MTDGPSPLRTTFRAPNSVDYEAIKRTAFRDQNILIAHIDDPKLPWQEQEILKAIGDRLYGKKAAGG